MPASPPISKPGAIIMVILVGSEVDKVMPVAPQIVKVFCLKKGNCLLYCVGGAITHKQRAQFFGKNRHTFLGIVHNIVNLHSTLHNIHVVWQPQ